MKALILLGVERGKAAPVCLYCGTDGEGLQAAAAKAAETKKFTFIGRVNNPFVVPLAVTSEQVVRTKPVRSVKTQAVTIKQAKPAGPLQKLQEQSDKLRANRLESLKKISEKKPVDTKPREDGPTFEDWLQKGFDPAKYPPAGFAEKDTPALKLYRDGLKKNNGGQKPAQAEGSPVKK